MREEHRHPAEEFSEDTCSPCKSIKQAMLDTIWTKSNSGFDYKACAWTSTALIGIPCFVLWNGRRATESAGNSLHPKPVQLEDQKIWWIKILRYKWEILQRGRQNKQTNKKPLNKFLKGREYMRKSYIHFHIHSDKG